ncbi:histidine phosphatase family protein [Tunturiibacter empetritectus]|uniref:Broad specificity phosphatase PhoE n=2 Tax=Tunturiibacter TaxID=3154218 RepID=A0A852V975_9BACT|nr:broad specificity phosphatase PhoE [Edaphobacter lichenicola]
MPARLSLISHAPTSATRLSAFPSDEPIEEPSIAKLTTINWQPPRAHHILTAPELRTQQTARALNLTATPANELRDLNYGIWQGRTLADLHAEDSASITQWLTDPTAAPHQGESITALITRVGDWLTTLTGEDTSHTIAITHPAVIRAAILHTLDAPPQSFWRIDIAPLTLTDLRHNGRTWTLRSAAIPLITIGDNSQSILD